MVWIVGFSVAFVALAIWSQRSRRRLSQEVLERGWTIDSRRRFGLPEAFEGVDIRPFALGDDRALHHEQLIEGDHEGFAFSCCMMRSRRVSGNVSEQTLGVVLMARLADGSAAQPSFEVAQKHAVTAAIANLTEGIEQQSGFELQESNGNEAFDSTFLLWARRGTLVGGENTWRQALLQHPQQLLCGQRPLTLGASDDRAFLTCSSLFQLAELDALLEHLAWWRNVLGAESAV